MGVDEAARAGGYGQMLLAGSKLEQQHVTSDHWLVSDGEAASERIGEPVIKPTQLERVTGRQLGRSADRDQRRRQQADTIEPGYGISAMKTKLGSNQRLCGPGECRTAHWTGEG